MNSTCEATCINTDGSHICECNNGYEFYDENSTVCTGDHLIDLLEQTTYLKFFSHIHVDINECLDNNGGCQCDPDLLYGNCTAECINTHGSYRCQCPKGYHINNSVLMCTGKPIAAQSLLYSARIHTR